MIAAGQLSGGRATRRRPGSLPTSPACSRLARLRQVHGSPDHARHTDRCDSPLTNTYLLPRSCYPEVPTADTSVPRRRLSLVEDRQVAGFLLGFGSTPGQVGVERVVLVVLQIER